MGADFTAQRISGFGAPKGGGAETSTYDDDKSDLLFPRPLHETKPLQRRHTKREVLSDPLPSFDGLTNEVVLQLQVLHGVRPLQHVGRHASEVIPVQAEVLQGRNGDDVRYIVMYY